jgi:hypothetical protein
MNLLAFMRRRNAVQEQRRCVPDPEPAAALKREAAPFGPQCDAATADLMREAAVRITVWRDRADALPDADRELIEQTLRPAPSPALKQALAQCRDIVERGMRGEHSRPTTFTRKLHGIKGGRG